MEPQKNARLREILKRPGLLPLPGCHDGVTARLIQKVGFEVCYMGGNATMGSALGLPDIGLGTATEMIARAHNLAECLDIPLVCDSDTGYGNTNNVWRTVRDYEAAGVSGIHIEDQQAPKRCGAMAGVAVISLEEMCDKVRAACLARRDPNFVIIARTDAYNLTDLDEVIRRCRAFGEAGADLVMPTCIYDENELRRMVSSVSGVPFLIDFCEFSAVEAGYTDSRLEDIGVKVALRPMTSILHTAKMLEKLYRHYRETGSMEAYYRDNLLMSQSDYQDLVGYGFVEELQSLVANRRNG